MTEAEAYKAAWKAQRRLHRTALELIRLAEHLPSKVARSLWRAAQEIDDAEYELVSELPDEELPPDPEDSPPIAA
jgi:hypothetical protein